MEAKLQKITWVVVVGLSIVGLAACDEVTGRGEQGEKVAIDQVPPAVKATIEQESKGGAVKDIEKLSQDGKTVYGADIVKNGNERESLIAEDGTIIKRGVRKVDDDDD
jgi:uncharacterized membrane protein YkoI